MDLYKAELQGKNLFLPRWANDKETEVSLPIPGLSERTSYGYHTTRATLLLTPNHHGHFVLGSQNPNPPGYKKDIEGELVYLPDSDQRYFVKVYDNLVKGALFPVLDFLEISLIVDELPDTPLNRMLREIRSPFSF
ncbi:hypothetical protein HON49_07950 [archaeon]|jgi:hypothetical protein|nr:hypothetical protein [archaeon]